MKVPCTCMEVRRSAQLLASPFFVMSTSCQGSITPPFYHCHVIMIAASSPSSSRCSVAAEDDFAQMTNAV